MNLFQQVAEKALPLSRIEGESAYATRTVNSLWFFT